MRDVVDKVVPVVFFPREFQFSRLGNIPPILFSPSLFHLLLTQERARVAGTLQQTVMLFHVSLTVHLGIILVKNQRDALYSTYLLFHLSTCFEHLLHITRRVNLY